MLDTFRKRDNTHPATPQQPASRPLGSSAASSAREAASAPRTENASAKPMLLDPSAMPGLSTGAQPSAVPSPAPQVAEQPQEEPASSARLVVGPEIKLRGAEITDCDTIIVEGEVDASMDTRVVEIAKDGVFRGKVEVDIAEIRGRFEGELTAHKRLVIRETGRVAGKIRYGKICIDEGGQLSGDIGATDPDAAAQRGKRSAELRTAAAASK